LARLFGFDGTAYSQIIDALDVAARTDKVKTVRLVMDTPGGAVNGVEEVRQAVADLAMKKHVIAENHGMIASAGYWIASAASEIRAISPTVESGSIGVVITQIDTSEREKAFGIKKVNVISRNAPEKAPDADTKAGRETIQQRADAIERIFINRVADGRGVTEQKVIKDFGRGALLVAKDPDENRADALSVGMIDSVNGSIFGRIEETVGEPTASASVQETITAGATPFADLPIVDKPWDSGAAQTRVRRATGSTEKPGANYKKAFFWYDAENAENFGAYKLPFADIVDGRMVAIRRGVFAANGAMKGARGGVQIPSADKPKVQAVIDRYIKKIEREDKKTANQPAGAGKQMEEKMNLQDAINESPDLASEVEAIKNEAFAEGAKKAEATIKAAIPYLAGSDYPESIKKIACDVLKGDMEPAVLTGAVIAFDALKEERNAKAAQDEQPDETPAQLETETISEDGTVSNEAEVQAAIDALKGVK